jgi:F0F1-type ATP synthase assembly protein I
VKKGTIKIICRDWTNTGKACMMRPVCEIWRIVPRPYLRQTIDQARRIIAEFGKLDKRRHARQALAGYNLALKFGTMFMVSICCSLAAGLFLDRQLGTTPWLMLILMLAGLVFSNYAIYKVASRMNKPDSHKEVDQP